LTAAVAEYKREIELFPKSYMAQFNLGKIYKRLGNVQDQMTAFQGVIASNPDFAEGHLLPAKLYLDVGQLGDARAMARRGLELKPRGDVAPLGHFVLSDVFAREGRPADAAREAAEGRRLAVQSSNR
jgi:tetratricopeptide (TPR) repeat protein